MTYRLSQATLEDCEMSVRTLNALKGWKPDVTLTDLAGLTDDDLRHIPHMTARGVKEIKEVIRITRLNSLSPTDEVVLWAKEHQTLILALMRGEAVIVPAPSRNDPGS